MDILLIEDDDETADFVASGLSEEGHKVSRARDGRQGLLFALDEDFDVLVVDRMLPRLDGLSLVRAAREAGCQTPVLFLTAMASVPDRVEGLTSGGDDYLTKPFAFSELLARVNLLGRRPRAQATPTVLSVADLTVDLQRQKVTRAGREIHLQPREFRLLAYLVQNRDRVVTRTMLLEAVWDINFDPRTNVVDTQISRLRDKIDKPFDRPLIHTVRGAGYILHE